MRAADLAALQEAEAMLSDAARLYAEAALTGSEGGALAEEVPAAGETGDEDKAAEAELVEEEVSEEESVEEELAETDAAGAETEIADMADADSPDTDNADAPEEAKEPDFARLAELRAAYAEEAGQYIEVRGGKPDMDAGEAYREAVNFAEGDADGGITLAKALSGETYIVDALRGYLAEEMISVETKTLFQLMLPDIRADRDRLALLVEALPAEDDAEEVAEEVAPAAAEEAEAADESSEEEPEEDTKLEPFHGRIEKNGVPVPGLKISLGAGA